MSNKIHSYSKIFGIGHPEVTDLLHQEVIVEEKIDGSQFSVQKLEDGTLRFRSKGTSVFYPDGTKMFQRACAALSALSDKLHVGWIYRGECLDKPKHNTLPYGRVPEHHFVLYDVEVSEYYFLKRSDKEAEAARIGLEIVPLLHTGRFTAEHLEALLMEATPLLGGEQKIEGVVIKPINNDQFGTDKKLLMAKFVRPDFTEVNRIEFRKANPTLLDAIDDIVEGLRTEARWRKAIERRRDAGELNGGNQDIGPLIKDICEDTFTECEELVKEKLWKFFKKKAGRKVAAGFPEWYKAEMVKAAMEHDLEE